MTDNETRATCRAQLKIRDEDGDTWDITYRDPEGVSQQAIPCGAFWSPDPDTQYQCVRRTGHPGLHLDDASNVLWRGTPWGAREEVPDTPILDGRHPADKEPVYVAPEDERDGNYLHGRTHDDLIKELYRRVSEVEGRRLPDIRRCLADTAARVSELEEVSRRHARSIAGQARFLDAIPQHGGEPLPDSGAVLIDPSELGSLLKDRQELHKLRNAAQADLTDESFVRCEWISPTKIRCNLPKGHTVDHITPYGPDHVCGPSCD